MSATEILKKIEELSPAERREISKRLFELEEDSESIQFSLHAADTAFRMLDEMEAEERRGEVWMVDLGLAAKARPCLLLTGYPADDELALITIVCHTAALRGNEWEIDIPKVFLKKGAFHFQQIQSVPLPTFIRCLGGLNVDQMTRVDSVIRSRLTGNGTA